MRYFEDYAEPFTILLRWAPDNETISWEDLCNALKANSKGHKSLKWKVNPDFELEDGEMVCLFVDKVDNPGLLATGEVVKVEQNQDAIYVIVDFDFSLAHNDDLLTLEYLSETIPQYDWANFKSGDVIDDSDLADNLWWKIEEYYGEDFYEDPDKCEYEYWLEK